LSTNHTKIINNYIKENTITEQGSTKPESRKKKKKEPEISEQDVAKLEEINFASLAKKLHFELEKTLPGKEGDILMAKAFVIGQPGFELEKKEKGIAQLTELQRRYFIKLFDAYNSQYKDMDLLKKLLDNYRQKPEIRYGIRAIIESLTYKDRMILFPVVQKDQLSGATSMMKIIASSIAIGALAPVGGALKAAAYLVSFFAQGIKLVVNDFPEEEYRKQKSPRDDTRTRDNLPVMTRLVRGKWVTKLDRYITRTYSKNSAFVYVKTEKDKAKFKGLLKDLKTLTVGMHTDMDKSDQDFKTALDKVPGRHDRAHTTPRKKKFFRSRDKLEAALESAKKKILKKYHDQYYQIVRGFVVDNRDNTLPVDESNYLDLVRAHLETPVVKEKIKKLRATAVEAIKLGQAVGDAVAPTAGSTRNNRAAQHYFFGDEPGVAAFRFGGAPEGDRTLAALSIPVFLKGRKKVQIGSIGLTNYDGMAFLRYAVGTGNNWKGKGAYSDNPRVRGGREGGGRAKRKKFNLKRSQKFKNILKSLFDEALKQNIIAADDHRALMIDLKQGLAPLAAVITNADSEMFKDKGPEKHIDRYKVKRFPGSSDKKRTPTDVEKKSTKKDSQGALTNFDSDRNFNSYKRKQDRLLQRVSNRLIGNEDLLSVDKIAMLLINGKITKVVKEQAGQPVGIFSGLPTGEKYFMFKEMVEEFQAWLISKGFIAKTTSSGAENKDGFFGGGTLAAFNDVVKVNKDLGGRFGAKNWLSNKLKSRQNIARVLEGAVPYSFEDSYKKVDIENSDLVSKKIPSDLNKYDLASMNTIRKEERYHVKDKETGIYTLKKLKPEEIAALKKEFEAAYEKKLTNIRGASEVKKEQFAIYLKTRSDVVAADADEKRRQDSKEKESARDANPLSQWRLAFNSFITNGNNISVIKDMINKLLPNLSIDLDKLTSEENVLKLFDQYLKHTGKGYGLTDHPMEDRYQSSEVEKGDGGTASTIKQFLSTEGEMSHFLNFLSSARVMMSVSKWDIFDVLLGQGIIKVNNRNFSKALYSLMSGNKSLYNPVYSNVQSIFNLYTSMADSEKKRAMHASSGAMIRFVAKHALANIKQPLEKAKKIILNTDEGVLDKILRDNNIKLKSLKLGAWIARLVRKGHLVPKLGGKDPGRYVWADHLKDPEDRKKIGLPSGGLEENIDNKIIERINSIIGSIFIDEVGKIQIFDNKITENTSFLNYFNKNKDPLEELVEFFDFDREIIKEVANMINATEEKNIFGNFYPGVFKDSDQHSGVFAKNKLTFIKENSKLISKNIYPLLMDESLAKINDFVSERTT
jgi:hypothetical protein